jgi:DNA-binding GntR family transcriptional regulator
MSVLAPLRLLSATHQAGDAIRKALAAGDYAPGTRLYEEQVAAELGISRVPVREALSALVAQGLLERRQRGVYVPELQANDLNQIYMAREALENVLYQSAAHRLELRDVAQVKRIAQKLEHAAVTGSIKQMTEHNRAFHFAIMERAELPLIQQIVATLWDRTTYYRAYYWLTVEHRSLTIAEHGLIVAACEAADGAELVRLHIQHRQELLAEDFPWLGRQSSGGDVERLATHES